MAEIWPTLIALGVASFDLVAVVIIGLHSIRMGRDAAQDGARAANATEASVKEARRQAQARRLERVLDALVELRLAVLALIQQGQPPTSDLAGDMIKAVNAAQARLRVTLTGFHLPAADKVASKDHTPAGLGEILRDWDRAVAEVTQLLEP